MAGSALKRRRGTRKASSTHGLLITILITILVVVMGLGAGLIYYSRLLDENGEHRVTNSQPNNFMEQPKKRIRRKILLDKPPQSQQHHDQDLEANHFSNHELFVKYQQKKKKNAMNVLLNAIPQAPPGSEERKQRFLDHTPEIGGKGKFPYYPNDGALVAEDHDFSTFEAPGGSRFEEYKWGDSPYDYQPGESDDLARSRRFHIRNAMRHAWGNYEKYAFGKDVIKPISLQGSDSWGGLGITLVDSLDTLWLMDMKEEFYRARDWVKDHLHHDQVTKSVSVFETTIRSLGGLLAAFDWSGDEAFLDQAKDLGSRLFKSFENPTGIPRGSINLATQRSRLPSATVITSEIATLQIEFRLLARWSGIKDYKTKSEAIFHKLHDTHPPHALYPFSVRDTVGTLQFANAKLTFGANADSFYEYMLKIWLQGGKTEPFFRDMYDESMQGMFDVLLSLSTPSELVFIADSINGIMITKQDHLACFMGGLLALGAYTDPQGLDSERAQRDLKTAKALTYTCYQTYARMASGISPEFVQFFEGKDFEAGKGASHYLLRPETVESFFVLYHLTGDPVYREWGWEVFQAIEKHCKVKGGYGSIKDVRSPTPEAKDETESFFLAETLKYLYLLFDPDTEIDLLNKHVFNTEAHPVRIFPQMDKARVLNLL